MAIVQVVQPGQKVEKEKESTLDKILKGVSLANAITSTYENVRTVGDRVGASKSQRELNKLALEQATDKREGIGPAEYDATKFISSKTPVPGAMERRYRKGDVIETDYLSPRAVELSPMDKARLAEIEANTRRADKKIALDEKELGLKERLAMKDAAEKAPEMVQGFEVAQGAKPTKDDAKILKQAAQFQGVIKGSLDKLDALVAEHGTEAFGAISDQMTKLATDARLNAKELYNLGVLSGPDMELMEKIIPDPGAAGTAVTWNSAKRAKAGIGQAKKIIEDRVSSIAEGRGFQRSAMQKKAPAGNEPFEGFNLLSKEEQQKALELMKAKP